MADVWQDVRHAVGALRARPSFTLAVVVTLALGLGVTTAVATVVYTVVWAPTPYEDAERIVQVTRTADGRTRSLLPPADVRTLTEGTEDLLAVGVSRFRDVAVTTGGAPERVRGVVVTGPTLGMLGVPPLLGRLPDASDDVPGGPCVTVLSHDVWSEHFGARRDAVGETARLDGEPCTILGVMPEDFAFPAPYFAPGDLWLLAGPSAVDWSAEAGPGFLVFGRMAPGVEREGVQAALDVLSARDRGEGAFTAVRWAARSREASRRRLLVLLAAAALVLVIATVNVVTLQVARYVDRTDEIATRIALGAGRGRLARLLLTETAVLAAVGAAGGLLVATWSVDLIVALRSFWIPRMEEAAVGGASVAVCLGLAAVVGAVAAAVPTLGLRRVAATGIRPGSARGSTVDRRGRRLGRTLVAVETALALVLLAGAALLVESYRGLTALDPGFRTEGVLHARVTPPAGRYPDDDDRVAFFRDVEEGVAALPGVRRATLAYVPPGVGAGARDPFAVAGREPSPGAWPRAAWRQVGEDYFRTLEIPLVRGRGFAEATGTLRVALVNEAFVRRHFPDGEVLGRRLHRVPTPDAEAPADEGWTVVGVVADAHEEYTFRPPPPAVYVRWSEDPPATVAILVRGAGEPLALVPAVRDAVAAVDPEQPVYGVRALEYIVESEYDLNRLGMALLALFAGAALLLAVAGIYGVVAHSVGRRLREMGIRVALGALRTDVLRLVVGDSARWAALGAAAGLGLLLLAGDPLRALTPGWAGYDPAVLAAAALLVTGVALGAAYLPARRAASADPMTVLREE